MKLKIIIWLFLISWFIPACKQKSSVPIVNFNERVTKSGIIDSFDNKFMLLDLCKIITVDWDSILVVPPYVDIKELDLINAIGINQIKSKVEMMSLADGAVHLIVIKDNYIVEYGEINRTLLDLLTVTEQNGKIKMLTKDDCNKFYINPKANDGELIKVYKN